MAVISDVLSKFLSKFCSILSINSFINVPFIDNESHIVPILVKGPLECKQISKLLLDDFGIYIQPVFYPTVPKGEERLRVTITPKHSKADIDNFISCIDRAWDILKFERVESNNLNSRA